MAKISPGEICGLWQAYARLQLMPGFSSSPKPEGKRKLLVKLQGFALTHRPSEGSSLLARTRFEAYG